MAFRKVSRGSLLLARRFPFRRAVRLQVVKIVFKQFVKRGSRNICEFYLRFLARTACRTPFGDVLLSAPGGLRHLIDRAVTVRGQKTTAECDRTLIDHIALAIDYEFSVSTMRQHDFGNFSHWSLLQGTKATEVT